MQAVLVAVPTAMQNSLQPLSTFSINAHHLLDFMVEGKITEADVLTVHLDTTPSGLSMPPPPSPRRSHFYAECPFCCDPLNLSWPETGTE